MLIPTVIEKGKSGDRAYDLYSRLLKDRIVFVTGRINDELANIVIAQLLFLEKESKKEDIQMFINSPGGHIYSGLAILDTMNYISCYISTIAVGMAASMASLLLTSGCKGKRFSLPNSKILIHQPLGGVEGQASDIAIEAEEILKLRTILNKILAKSTGQKISQIERDVDRDKYFTAKEAREYGLIDKVIRKR